MAIAPLGDCQHSCSCSTHRRQGKDVCSAARGQWARRALESGKHVLCEKPFCTNAAEARELQSLALKNGLICREAFHYREHPLATRLREITLGPPCRNPEAPTVPQWMAPPAVAGGAGGLLGQLESIDVQVLIPKWVFGDANIRFLEELAGGAMMDAGTYAVSIMRLLTGSEPCVESASASMRPGSKVVDGAMRARLSWDTGIAGTLHASLQHDGWLPVTQVQVEGERGSLMCKGFIVPFFGHSLRVTTKQADGVGFAAATTAAMSSAAVSGSLSKRGEKRGVRGEQLQWTERVFGEKQQTSYYHQLERFTTDLQLLEGRRTDRDIGSVNAACAFDAYDSVANMATLDACFEAAGLPLRIPTAEWQQHQQQQQQQQRRQRQPQQQY
ncbi:hypothetical protein DUNSADRAFT_17975 [Dunaliella salina]|uniref:D-xylose 1-dehydrogenase (NADP(+), D-xylono-1,5-lactone-forming) n=1 Tax=Dunaliella salina TaxID=3046 RepID=A0ABQ7GZL3_DUNSA|nr:hypothetical protein DUNSADRAFT_17975 [Dunaliella salina]|eukprot:KAF5840056.1 hypothetical protein DUNSADRAFT_17975 [Dunaliella salina]